MAKYVLGEEGARKFKQLTKQVTGIKNRISLSPTHVIDNLYPHPYEIRWSESQISGGGYMMWLPDNCLQVNGYNCPPNTWLPNVGDAKLEPDLSTDYWYDLQKALPDIGQNLSSMSSFDIFLNAVGGEVLMSLSSTNKWPGVPGFVHIASVKNFRAKPNVKSNLILDIKSTPFQLYRLPDNDSSLSGKIPQWEMQYQVWESGNKIMQLPNCQITADGLNPDSLKPRYIRLVELSSGTWLIDSKFNDGSDPNIQLMNDLEIGEILTPDVTTEDLSAKSVHPLYYMNSFNGVGRDIREAWYIINDVLSCDKVSIANESSDSDGDLSSVWRDKIRLWGFHSVGDSTAYDVTTSFVVRQNGSGVATPPAGDEYLDYLNVWSFRTGILQQVTDTLLSGHAGGILSALEFDEQSVSKGGDGWTDTDLSGNPVSCVHMWHFHDSEADVNSPEMCDIVLRYNPNPSSEDKWLRYISYDDFKEKLSADIGGGGGGSSGGEISADQLSAIPSPGMFAWTESTRNMGVGGCMVGRKWYTCTSGIGSGKADNLYQLRVTIDTSGGVALAVVSDATLGQSPTTTQCWIPIYRITDGKIAADYRGAFVVPAYE